MAQDWRLKTYLKNNSFSVNSAPATIGFTSIIASKGIAEPTLFDAGEVQKVLDTFGYPSSTYPGIQDVIDYVSSYPCYVSAPFDTSDALHGGVFVLKTGTVAFLSGLSTNAIADFSAITVTEALGTGDGSTVLFTATLDLPSYYTNQTIDILVDGVSQAVSATDAEPEVLSDASSDTGTYTRATGVLAFTFNSAPALAEVITVQRTINLLSDCYFALISTSPQTDDLAIKLTSLGVGQFTLNMYRQDSDDATVYNLTNDSPLTVSNLIGDKDGFGNPIYLDTVFEDDIYITAVVNTALAFTTFVDDTVSVAMVGGDRGTTPTASVTITGYDFITTSPDQYDDVIILFDTTAETTISTKFETIRGSTSYLPRVRALFPLANSTATALLVDADTSKNNMDDRGLNAFALTWFTKKDLYNDTPFVCSCMGLIAKRYADSISLSLGGLSPMYTDENGIGGQLGSSVIKQSNTATESQLQSFVEAGINPVKKLKGSGYLIAGDQTTKSSKLSDYSYTIHSQIADYILENVESQVLTPQMGKPNDELHRTNVRSQAELIVSNVSDYLEDYEIKCDLGNNTDAVRAQRKFVLTIGVIFQPNSQKIDFNFVNSNVGTDISEVVNKSS